MESSLLRELSAPASEVYETIEFKTNSLYNKPAPEPWIAFMIGGIFFAISAAFWWCRYCMLYQRILQDPTTTTTTTSSSDTLIITDSGKVKTRIALAAWIDNDQARFVICKTAFYAFTYLGGFQLDYSLTFNVMLGWFVVEAAADVARILITFYEVNDLDELVIVSKVIQRKIGSNHKGKQYASHGDFFSLFFSSSISRSLSHPFLLFLFF